MEEVDRIILHSLRQIGCDIEDDVGSLKQFTTELVYEASVRCLQLITSGFELSHRLPPAMAQRFRAGSTLAQACMDLGYSGDVGYQTFLYWDETDIRKILMFLIEKLPKESEKTLDQPQGAMTLLQQKIAAEAKDRLRAPWLPPQFHIANTRWMEDHSLSIPFFTSYLSSPKNLEDIAVNIPKEIRHYYSEVLDFVTFQPIDHDNLASSIIETNATLLAKSRINEASWDGKKEVQLRISEKKYRAEKKQRILKRVQDLVLQEISQSTSNVDITSCEELLNVGDGLKTMQAPGVEKIISENGEPSVISESLSKAEVITEQNMETEQQALKKRVEELTVELERLKSESSRVTGALQQVREQRMMEQRKKQQLEEALSIQQKTLDLLPDAEVNLAKLQNVVEATAQRLINLATQWEHHRAPLFEQYRNLRELNANRVSESQRKLDEIRSLREKMTEIATVARTKEELHRQLLAECEKTTQDVNRSAYTRRILEIVANIKKQKEDIDKILVDTKAVQKEINQLSGKLERTFAVTDELVFRDAKKDESVRKAYKYLAALHENCCSLVKTVEETGAIMREIRDLEDQIENESQKKVLANLERITADYRQMKQENATLIAKLREQN